MFFYARIILLGLTLIGINIPITSASEKPKLAYLVSDIRIPFWEIMSRGIVNKAEELGYDITVMTAANDPKEELVNIVQVVNDGFDGIVVSPNNTSTCVTILAFAEKANIPVVISDIGTESGKHLSFISSNNYSGSYELGKILVEEMKDKGYRDGTVGIVAIPQKRVNGQARTAGFLNVLLESGIRVSGIEQQVTFSHEETYRQTTRLIQGNKDIKAIWLQGSDRYQAALDAIKDTGNEGKILLLTFDAEPEFIEMIEEGSLVGAGMQQPYLMGELAVTELDAHLKGKEVSPRHELEVLAISKENIKSQLGIIKRNVFGMPE